MDAHGFVQLCQQAELRRELGNPGYPVLMPALRPPPPPPSALDRAISEAILRFTLQHVLRPKRRP